VTATFDRTTITGNTATGVGGGINLGLGSSLTGVPFTVTNSLIANNTASNGGGFYIGIRADITVNNSTVAFNRAASGNGGGFSFYDANLNTETIRNSILWGNSASGSGQTMYVNNYYTSSPNVHIYDSIIANDNDGVLNNYPYFNPFINNYKYCDTNGYMSESDPMFVDPENIDYHLKSRRP
jgi:hypothetical protein